MHLTREEMQFWCLRRAPLVMAAGRAFAAVTATVKALKPGEFIWPPGGFRRAARW